MGRRRRRCRFGAIDRGAQTDSRDLAFVLVFGAIILVLPSDELCDCLGRYLAGSNRPEVGVEMIDVVAFEAEQGLADGGQAPEGLGGEGDILDGGRLGVGGTLAQPIQEEGLGEGGGFGKRR